MKTGIMRKFKTFVSLLLILVMVVGIMPMSTIADAVMWDLRSATVEYNGKNIYLFGVDTAELQSDTDPDNVIIQYFGANNLSQELYVNGVITGAAGRIVVDNSANTLSVQKQWLTTESGWVGIKLSDKAYVPQAEPGLPEITGVTVEGVSTSYQGSAVEAVTVTGAEDCTVEYSVDGASFTLEKPMLDAPTADPMEITVRVTKNGYRELLKNVTASMAKGRVPVEVKPVNTPYNGSEISLLGEPVYDSSLATLSYRVTGDADFTPNIPVRKDAGSYEVEIKVTPTDVVLYEEYTFTKTASISSLAFGDDIKIIPKDITYNATAQQAFDVQYTAGNYTNLSIMFKPQGEPDTSYTGNIPMVQYAGTYDYDVKITADGYDEYVTTASITVKKAEPQIAYVLNENAVYNETTSIPLVTNAVVDKGEAQIEYSLNGGEFSNVIPNVNNAGTYTLSIRMPETANYAEKYFETDRAITVAKANFEMKFSGVPTDIAYNENNKFTYKVENEDKLPQGTIEYSLDSSTTADAVIDKTTGEVTYTGPGAITVKAKFIESDGINYTTGENKEATYTLNVNYLPVPPDWNVFDTPYTNNGGFDFYKEKLTVTPPAGWTVRLESVDFTGSTGTEEIEPTDWQEDVTVTEFGSYENFTVRFKNDVTNEISEAFVLGNFAINNEDTFNKVTFFNLYKTNEDTFPTIINILTFGVFCGEEVKIAATVPQKQIGNSFESAEFVEFCFGEDNTVIVEVSENRTAVVDFPDNFSGTIKARAIGFNGQTSDYVEMTNKNSNVQFDTENPDETISVDLTVDLTDPVINSVIFSQKSIDDENVFENVIPDEDATITVRKEFNMTVDVSDNVSGIGSIEVTLKDEENGKEINFPKIYQQLDKEDSYTIENLKPYPIQGKTKITVRVCNNATLVSEQIFYVYGDSTPPEIKSIAPVKNAGKNLLVQGNYDENNKNNFVYFANGSNESGKFKVTVDDTRDGTVFSSEGIKVSYRLIGTDNSVVEVKTVDTVKEGNKNTCTIDVGNNFKGWIVLTAFDGAGNPSNDRKDMSSVGIIVADAAPNNQKDGSLTKPELDENIKNTTKPSDFVVDDMIIELFVNDEDSEEEALKDIKVDEVSQKENNNRDIYADVSEMNEMFKVTLTDNFAGIKDIQFYTYCGNAENETFTQIGTENLISNGSVSGFGIDTQKEYTIKKGAFDYNYHDQALIVKVTDNIGYLYCMYYKFGTDGENPGEPTIDVTGTHNGDNEWFTGTAPVNNISHEEDANGTLEFVKWKWKNSDYVLFDKEDDETKPVIKLNGEYEITAYAYDEAERRSDDVPVTIKYDSVPPEFDVLLNGVIKDMDEQSGYYFFKDSVEITINAVDGLQENNSFIGSGIGAVQYKIVYKNQNPEEVSWSNYEENSKPKVMANNAFVLYVKVTDNAGNTTQKSSRPIVVDNKPPVGVDYSRPEISYSVPATATGFYTDSVNVDVTVIDHKYIGNVPNTNGSCSGVDSLTYTLKVDGEIIKENVSLVDNTQSGSITEREDVTITLDKAECNSNNIEITLYAKDKAGNETKYVIEEGKIKIDVTDPTIYVSYDNNSPVNDHFYNNTRTATIVVTERNLDYNDVDITVTNTDGTAPVYSQWVKTQGTGNGDNTTHTMTVFYNADGDYTFDVKASDMAGNTDKGTEFAQGTTNPDSFTVDMTKPVVSVGYDNNSAQNGKYFKEVRNATVTVVEHNFDLQFVTSTITASLEGQGISVPQLSWSHSGDTHTAYIAYTADGDYTFDFDMADLAANKIDGVNYGSSVAAQEFTVDTTIEEPAIAGVENGMPYKETVIPEVSFSDINYSDYSIKLTRTRMNEIDVDVTDQFIAGLVSEDGNGGSGVFDTFERIRENDGIYRLEVTMNDLAGNTATSEVMFSVNRFGSVYVFGDYLISLQDAYVQKVSDDLVITEYNPDKLLENSVNIQVTHDSSPLSTVNYKVNPLVNNAVSVGESGWYQYEYVIDASNFEKDGVYSLVISSADEAGNMPETINFDDLEVLFRVDTVKPELTDIKGLEEAIVNSTGVDVTFSMFDAIGLKKVDIYISGEKVATLDASENMINFVGEFAIGEGADQSIRIVAEDMAGNILDTDSDEFATELSFVKSITVSTNFFVRWYANKVLFWSSIAVAVLLVGGIVFFIYRRKREQEE